MKINIVCFLLLYVCDIFLLLFQILKLKSLIGYSLALVAYLEIYWWDFVSSNNLYLTEAQFCANLDKLTYDKIDDIYL
jgi:hypothetical protein